MAAKTTVKVAVHTGAAKDDNLLSSATGLTQERLTANLDVLGNDPGSARLYSLQQNASAFGASTQFPLVSSLRLPSGATISINADGTVRYDAASISDAIKGYGTGEFFTDTFEYTIRMANGALSTAKASVQIAGENDVPTLAAVAAAIIDDTAQAAADVRVQASLQGVDSDRSAVLAYGFADGVDYAVDADGNLASSNEYGTIRLDPNTGDYEFIATAARIDALAQDESHTVSFAFQVRDEQGAASAPVTAAFTLQGANDGPTLASVAAVTISDTPKPAASVSVQGALQGMDVDHGAVLTYGFAAGVNFSVLDGKLVSTSDYGTIALDTATGAYEFTATAARLDGLSAGQNVPVSFAFEVRDEHGAASAPVNVVFKLEGADEDVPAATPAAAAPNPVVTWFVNQGQSDINQKYRFSGFDSNDLIKYSSNYEYVKESIERVDSNGDGIADSSSATFKFANNGGHASTVKVVLVGYTELTEAQIGLGG